MRSIIADYYENRDGVSTISKDFIKQFAPEEIGKEIKTECTIKPASVELRKIIEENDVQDIIIKCDTEGAEYEIFEDLAENYPQIFDKTHKIVGDTHLGFERFYNAVKPFGYKVIWKNPQENGPCCAFELSKEIN